MKHILLSADNEISVFSVPDEVANHLEQYCLAFCRNWLHKSPQAKKYRMKMGSTIGMRYSEKDFIDYLNQYICNEQSRLITTLVDVYDKEAVPEEYAELPYYNF